MPIWIDVVTLSGYSWFKSQRRKAFAVTVRIVGREPELRQFSAARARVRGGTTATFVVEGEPGIGKTRLLDELRVQALQEHWNVVDWRCAEFDVDRPFVAAFCGIDELVREFAERDDVLPPEIDEAHRALKTAASTGGVALTDEFDGTKGQAVEQSVHGDAIVQLMIDGLLELARSAPTLLLVDDTQWIDNASSKILWGLAGRPRMVPLLTVAAFRPDRRDEVRLLRRGLESQGATNLFLGTLTPSEAEALVAELVGSQTGRSIGLQREFALRESRGNPLFITELLRFEGNTTVDSESNGVSAIPKALRALITRRFDALGPETKHCLHRAAALGNLFDVDELGVVLAQPLTGVLETLGPAIDLGILVHRHGQLSFQHAIVHQIVQEMQPTAVRSALHFELAQSLANVGWTATRVGEHFFHANLGPSEEAAKWLRAASLEVRPLSLEAALAWSQRALVACTEVSAFEAELEVAGLLILLGRLADAEALCSRISHRVMSVEEEIRFRLSHAALITMADRTRDHEAIESFQWVRSKLSPQDARHVELLGWQAILLVFGGQLDEAERIATEALNRSVSGDRSKVVSGPLEALGLIAMLRGDTDDALRFSRESTDAYRNHRNVYSSVMVPHFALAMAMLSSCPIQEVIATLQKGLDLCDLAGHELARSHLEPITAIAYLAAGQLDIGRSIIDTAVRRNSNWRDNNVALPPGSALAAMVALLTDDVPTATTLAQRSFDELLEGGAQAGSADFAFWCIANVAEEHGDIGKARDLLVGVWEMFAKDASLYLIAPDLVRLSWSDQPDFAADVVARCEARAKRSGAAVDRANALATRGFLERDLSLLDAARDAWEELDWKLIPTRISGYALELLDAKKNRVELQRRLDLIIAEWEFMEAPQPVRVLRERYANVTSLRTTRTKPSKGAESLSQAERNVVRLVSAGLTNKEIAKQLYISHRTVDTHVSHALAKLDFTSRVQLATLVAMEAV